MLSSNDALGSKDTLAERIRSLQAERDRHAREIAAIDQVLGRISEVLGMGSGSRLPSLERTKRSKGRFALTAEQSVLQFIREKKNPSTADINGHWRGEGRKGTANVTILKLLKQNAIRRENDPQVRGSRYVARGGR